MIETRKETISMKKITKTIMQFALVVPVLALVASAAGVVQPVSAACDPTDGLPGSADCAKGTGQSDNLAGDGGVFQTVTNILLFIIGAVAVIMLVIGGIRYTISNGDANQVTSAKNTILYAIIGIVVAILAYAAVNFVITAFA
jgi:hypothetical protein